jgi:acyl dehydratase
MNAGLAPLRPGDELQLRTLVARNTAAADTGSIHDDAYAARMGYRGGLVPGVTLLAYCTPTLIDAFGEAWAQRGRLRARFLRPAYDGETLAVRATVARAEGSDVTLGCRIERADGAACVEAEASCLLDEQPLAAKPWRTAIPVGPAVPLGGGLPPLAPENMTIGQEFSPLTYRLSLAESDRVGRRGRRRERVVSRRLAVRWPADRASGLVRPRRDLPAAPQLRPQGIDPRRD